MPFGVKPEGCSFYAVDKVHRFEMIAWSRPPQTGDAVCYGTVGCNERELVRRILNGDFDAILHRAEANGSGAVDP